MSQSEEAFEMIVAALATRGFEAEIDGASDIRPVAQVQVVVHVDEQDRPYIAQGTFLNDITETLSGAEAAGDTVYLQLSCILPFELSGPERLADVGTLLFMLNRLMPLPQFGLSEVDGLVYLRAVVTAASRAVPPAMACEAIEMMQVFLESWNSAIERVATGRTALEDELDKLHAEGLVVPGLFPAVDDG